MCLLRQHSVPKADYCQPLVLLHKILTLRAFVTRMIELMLQNEKD